MKTLIPSVKGARDFYPEQMAARAWLYGKLRQVSESFGYQEYDGPFLEKIDLYAAKSGEELVKEQAFTFQDRGGETITLRPELTPSLARMVAQRQGELAFPLRWWSFGPFWRYERPQKGRSREFFQWNIDLIGANSVEADVELLALAANFFQRVGLSSNQVALLVNSRKLMDRELAELGIGEEMKKTVFRLIDRRDKLPPAEWRTYAVNQGLDEMQLDGLSALLTTPDLWKRSPDLVTAFEMLAKMGVGDYIRFDPQIIRGLDYYTGIVFEAKDLDGGRSILGGGHYDNLVSDVGGEPVPAVGFAMGDVMVQIVLEKYSKLPAFAQVPAAVLVTAFDAGQIQEAYAIGARMRARGLNVICYPEAVKLQKQLKYADRIGVRFVVIQGPDEAAAGAITVKDLKDRTQSTLPFEQALEMLVEKAAGV